MNKGGIVEAVLQRIDRTWSGRLELLYKLSTLLFTLAVQQQHTAHSCESCPTRLSLLGSLSS